MCSPDLCVDALSQKTCARIQTSFHSIPHSIRTMLAILMLHISDSMCCGLSQMIANALGALLSSKVYTIDIKVAYTQWTRKLSTQLLPAAVITSKQNTARRLNYFVDYFAGAYQLLLNLFVDGPKGRILCCSNR